MQFDGAIWSIHDAVGCYNHILTFPYPFQSGLQLQRNRVHFILC